MATDTTQQVITFDGVKDYIELGSKPVYQVQALTLEAWVCPAAQSNKFGGIVSKMYDHFAPGSFTKSGYGILSSGDNGIKFALVPKAGPTLYKDSGKDTLTTGKWHHVAFTYDGQTMRGYIDGKELLTEPAPAAGIEYDPDNSLSIGRYHDKDEVHYFRGKITEVRLWNQARSSKQITDHKDTRLTGSEAGLVSYWSLNGDTRDYCRHSSGGIPKRRFPLRRHLAKREARFSPSPQRSAGQRCSEGRAYQNSGADCSEDPQASD